MSRRNGNSSSSSSSRSPTLENLFPQRDLLWLEAVEADMERISLAHDGRAYIEGHVTVDLIDEFESAFGMPKEMDLLRQIKIDVKKPIFDNRNFGRVADSYYLFHYLEEGYELNILHLSL